MGTTIVLKQIAIASNKEQILQLELANKAHHKLLAELKALDEPRAKEAAILAQINPEIAEFNQDRNIKLDEIKPISVEELTELNLAFAEITISSTIQQISEKLNREQTALREQLAYQIKLIELLGLISGLIQDNLSVTNLDEDIVKLIDQSQINTSGKTSLDFFHQVIGFGGLCTNEQLLKYVQTKISSLNADIPVLEEQIIRKDNKLDALKGELFEVYKTFPSYEKNTQFALAYNKKEELTATIQTNETKIAGLGAEIVNLEAEIAIIEEKQRLRTECLDAISEVAKLGFSTQDTVMQTYLQKNRNLVNDNKDNIAELEAIKANLVKVSTNLHASTEVKAVQKVIINLANRNAWYTVGVGDKIKKIKLALLETPVEERATVLTSKTNAVQRALAAKRPVFFGGLQQAKEDTKGIVRASAAKAFDEAMTLINK
ncbi:MAG: hypothetical protein WC627_03740 [Legionella sp.]|jgi:hypothetical protein